MKPNLIPLLSSICLLGFVNSAHGVLLASESFPYPAGNLNGDGTADGAWTAAWAETPVDITQVDAGSSLAYSGGGDDLLTSGGKAVKNTTSLNSLTRSTVISETGNNPLWISFLFNPTDIQGGQGAGTDMYQLGFATAANTSHEEVGVRIQSDGSNGIVAYADINSTLSASSVALTLNTTYLFVLEYNEGGGTDTVNLTINPTNLGSSETAPTGGTTISTSGNTAFSNLDQFRFRTRRGGNDFEADEIRIGNSYGDVVPTSIPEPATAAFFVSLGALGIVCWRRRK